MNNKQITYHPPTRNHAPVKYLCIAAHHDDIEIMASDGIIKGQQSDASFVGVVVTDGAGSARSGSYANVTDDEMKRIRMDEQKKSADLGYYHAVEFLNYSSAETKDKSALHMVDNIIELITQYKPVILYTHNLCDKHATHIGVVLKVIQALRQCPKEALPKHVYGVEVWRDLDWMPDHEKVVFDVTTSRELTKSQLLAFDSQVAGGKRYDLATEGRRLANATYFQSHDVDQSEQLIFAMDLTPLIKDSLLDIGTFVSDKIDRFKSEVLKNINE